MSRPWMPLYVADYLADTQHLSTIEHGAYDLLIMHYWRHGGLPVDEEKLRIITKLTRTEWCRYRDTLAAFFTGWKHKRIDREIEKANEKHERRQNAGRRGGIAAANAKQNSSNAGSNAQASSSQPQPQSQEEPSLRSGTRARGSRIADDWEPSSPDLKFALDCGMRLFDVELEAAKFRDYWRARAGPNGVKLDWPATWRNWIRKAQENHSTRLKNGTGSSLMDAFDRLDDRAASAALGDSAEIRDITPGSDQGG